MASPADNRRGILAMLLSVAAFVTNDMFVRLAAATLPTGEIMVLRSIAAISLVVAIAIATGAMSQIRQLGTRFILLRGVLEATIAAMFITALPRLPFADITAILLAASLISTGLAAVLGIEKVGVRRWAALIVGSVGVVIMLRPGLAGLTSYALMALACTLLVAIRDLATRRINAAAPTIIVTLGAAIGVGLSGLAVGILETSWRWPSGQEVLWLLAAGVTVTGGNFMVVEAFRRADIAVVSPFRYTSLVLASLYGFVIWREWPDRWTVLGSILIVGSGLYTIWRERVRAREAAMAGRQR
jgi:drug/metabolite transporter (DMT)-like permease